MRRLLYTLLFALCSFSLVSAEERWDSLRVSLLTCSPGSEIYELFGHTAIRIEDSSKGIDVVYNYGLFSFETPNFIWRFVKGETDYCLGAAYYADFRNEYDLRGSYIMQDELNLTADEKMKLLLLLQENSRPENRVYRYNYFFDNCTSRARDIIEEALQGTIIYGEMDEKKSFRDIVHHFTEDSPWSEFGIDLLIGSGADRLTTSREYLFVPDHLSDAFQRASVMRPNGDILPLVKENTVTSPLQVTKLGTGFPFTPFQTTGIVFVLTVILLFIERHYNKVFWLWDILLYGVQGLAGCVIAFLFFFSLHPTVDSNYLLIWLNPIPLLYLPVMVYCIRKRKRDLYHPISVAILLFFCVFAWAIPQHFNAALFPFMATLVLRSISHIYYKR